MPTGINDVCSISRMVEYIDMTVNNNGNLKQIIPNCWARAGLLK